MQNTRLDESQAGNQDCWEKYKKPQIGDDTTLMTESEELKSLFMRVPLSH